MRRPLARTHPLTRTLHRLVPLLCLALTLASCAPPPKAQSAPKPPSKSFAAELDAPVTETRADSWQPPAKPIDAKGAVAAVRAFDSVVVIAGVSPIVDAASGTTTSFRVNTTDGRAFEVDAAGGVVVRVPGQLRFKPVPKDQLPLNDGGAVQRAADFVRAVFPAMDDVRVDGVSYGKGDSVQARWAQRDAKGALLPKWVRVTVDKRTGVLSDYEAQCSNDKTPIKEPAER